MTAENLILLLAYAREQRNAPEINEKSAFLRHLAAEKWQTFVTDVQAAILLHFGNVL